MVHAVVQSCTPRRARDQREIGVERITWTMVYVCARRGRSARAPRRRARCVCETPAAPRVASLPTRPPPTPRRGAGGPKQQQQQQQQQQQHQKTRQHEIRTRRTRTYMRIALIACTAGIVTGTTRIWPASPGRHGRGGASSCSDLRGLPSEPSAPSGSAHFVRAGSACVAARARGGGRRNRMWPCESSS